MIHRHRSLASCTDHHLTSVSPDGPSDPTALRRWLDRWAAVLAEHAVQPLQERMVGPIDGREQLLSLRRAALRDHHLDDESPCAFIDGRPGERPFATALQLWGIAPSPGSELSVATVLGAGAQRGRLLTGTDVRLLWLTSVDGRTADGQLANGVTAQGHEMLCGAIAALQAHGFTLRDVARTWIYLRRILDWYGEFNRVRTSIFREHGLTGRQQAPPFPASTGIQGTRAGEECTMELLAAQGSTSRISFDEVADSARQNRAFAYGSAFSRAISLRWQGADTILVSGTASIGTDGRTRHLGEPEAQLVETLMAIAALVAPRGCRLTDMASGTVYFKNDEARAAFGRVTRQLELPDLPLVPVRADVCRPELLVEIEAIILGPDDARREPPRRQETRDVR